MNGKTKRYVAMLEKRAMRASQKVRYQEYSLDEAVQYMKASGKNFTQSKEWRTLRAEAIEKYGNACLKCGREGTSKHPITIDHIKPRKYYPELALDINNLQPLCGACKKEKGNTIANYRTTTSRH